MSGKLVGRVLRSSYGCGDPNVRLLFLTIAEEHGNPRQKDPDGWIRLGIRQLADRIGCDHATVPDVIDRAEDAGLKVDWPGPKRRLGYMLPPDLYPDGEQVKSRPRPRPTGGTVAPGSEPSQPPQTGGIVPPDLAAPCHHVPSVTPSSTGEAVQPGGTGSHNHASSSAVASGGRAANATSLLRAGDRGASLPTSSTTTVALWPGTTDALRAREDQPPTRARATPATLHNRPSRRKEQHVSVEAYVWDQVPLPAEPLDLIDGEEPSEDCLEAQPA